MARGLWAFREDHLLWPPQFISVFRAFLINFSLEIPHQMGLIKRVSEISTRTIIKSERTYHFSLSHKWTLLGFAKRNNNHHQSSIEQKHVKISALEIKIQLMSLAS